MLSMIFTLAVVSIPRFPFTKFVRDKEKYSSDSARLSLIVDIDTHDWSPLIEPETNL